MTEQETTTAEEKQARANALRAAYSEATTTLRERHREEFDALHVEAAKKRGVEYTPRPTKADRARQQILDLLRDNPDLEQELIEKISSQVEQQQATAPAEA
jgi:hypothetical protein